MDREEGANVDLGVLKAIPLFARMAPEALRDLTSRFRPTEVESHRLVVWFGEAGDTFYVVAQGHLSVLVPSEKGQEREVNRLGPGGFFGELSLLDGGPRTATVRTVERSTLLVLGRADFLEFVARHPAAATAMLVVMAERQRHNLALLREQPNPTQAFAERGSLFAQGASRVVDQVSTWWFATVHIVIFTLWFGVNILAHYHILPAWMEFDEAYAFNKFKMLAAMESMLLTIFVLTTQRATRSRDRAKAEIEYQINLKAQTQISELIHTVNAMKETLDERLKPVQRTEQPVSVG